MNVCVCVCVFLASYSSETVEVVIIKLGMVTALDTWYGIMHYVLIKLALAFIQGHTDLNHENNKRSIISETVSAIPIKFGLKIVSLDKRSE